MQRRNFLQTGLFAIPLLTEKLPFSPRDSSPTSASVKAMFITDMHLSPRIDRSRVASEFLVEYIKKNPKLDLIINGGDSVYDVAKLKYPDGEDLWRFWRSVRDQIKIPVYNCLGNHDIYEWELSKEEISQPQDSKTQALQHLDMPGKYYSFKAGRWKFIVLDSHSYVVLGYKGALDADQVKWFAEELEKDLDYRVAVISHIPIISACASLYLTPEQNHLWPLVADQLRHTDAPVIFDTLKNRRVDLFLHGHLHMQESIRYKDSLVYNGGAFCADLWRGPFHAFKCCFTLIDFPDTGPAKMTRIDLPDTI